MVDNMSQNQLLEFRSNTDRKPLAVLLYQKESTPGNVKDSIGTSDMIDYDYCEPDHDNMITTSSMEDISEMHNDPISSLKAEPRGLIAYMQLPATNKVPSHNQPTSTVAARKLELIQMITDVYCKNLIKNRQHDISTVLYSRDIYRKHPLTESLDPSLCIYNDKRSIPSNLSHTAGNKRSIAEYSCPTLKKHKS